MKTLRYSRLLVPALALGLFLMEPAALQIPLHADPSSIVTTGSGLKYMDLAVGTGPVPAIGSTVVVKYEGKLLDGTVFDASSMHPEGTFTYTQGVTRLVEGWTEGVSSMHEGGKRKLIVPPELGYGMDGLPGVIPPNATLVFVIELVKVNPAPAAK